MPPLSNDGRPPLYPVSPSSVRIESTQDYQSIAKRVSFTRRPQHVVTFARIEIHPVQSHNDYSQEEFQETWYSPEELSNIAQDTMEEARRITRRISRWKDCPRGLESRTSQGFQETGVRRMKALLAVLSEQECQRRQNMEDKAIISQIYFDMAEEAKMQALDRAAVDALEAEMYKSQDSSDEDREDEEDDSSRCCFFMKLPWLQQPRERGMLQLL